MANPMSDPDHLLFSLFDLGKIAWAARKREMKRTPTIWMVDQEISKIAKAALLTPEVAEAYIPFYNMDLVKYSVEPEFHAELSLRFRDIFGMHIEEALLDGTLIPHDRACQIGNFTAKTMNLKLFGAKKAVSPAKAASEAAGEAGGGADGATKPKPRRNSMPVLPTSCKIGDYMKATKITMFKGGKKIMMHVVTGVSEVTQSLADPVKEFSAGLRACLELCIAGKKAEAQTTLKKVSAKWAADLIVARTAVREHIVFDGMSGKHAADVDDEGFRPLVPSTQAYEVTPKARTRERRASVEEFMQPEVGAARGVRNTKTPAEINHNSEARQEAARLRSAALTQTKGAAIQEGIGKADLKHLYTADAVASKHEEMTAVVRGDAAKETIEVVREGAKSDRTDWERNPHGEDNISHAEGILLFNKKSHLHDVLGGK